jgi:hypothetical protein
VTASEPSPQRTLHEPTLLQCTTPVVRRTVQPDTLVHVASHLSPQSISHVLAL